MNLTGVHLLWITNGIKRRLMGVFQSVHKARDLASKDCHETLTWMAGEVDISGFSQPCDTAESGGYRYLITRHEFQD